MSVSARTRREFRDGFLDPVALIREREFRAFARPRLRDGQAMIVGWRHRRRFQFPLNNGII